ncbi:MAG: sugar ABC transporter permease [Alphaproteobacteria bacterium]|nr:sugar ABC transporter permease [Alphaproteobacteria bacterium]
MSLHEVQLAPGKADLWAGIDNFTRLFSDKNFARGWVTLFKYSALCLSVEISLGVLVAVILNNSRLEKLFITIFLMPMMMAPVVAGFLYMFLYNGTFGWYFWLLRSLGVLHGGTILGSKSWAMAGIVATDVWQWTPLIALITLAGLKRVPQEQLEANMVDGAGPLRNFFSVALPNLYPFLLIAILLRFMDNFRFIDTILIMTGGGPANATKILPTYLFDVSFKFFELGRGAAIAFTLLLLTILLGLALTKIFEDPTRKIKTDGMD